MITAAHSSVPELQLNPEASLAANSKYISVYIYGSMAHEKMTVLHVLFWQEATLPASLLGPLMKVQFLLRGTGGDEEQGRRRAYRSTTANKEGGSDVMKGVWRGSALVLN